MYDERCRAILPGILVLPAPSIRKVLQLARGQRGFLEPSKCHARALARSLFMPRSRVPGIPLKAELHPCCFAKARRSGEVLHMSDRTMLCNVALRQHHI